MMKECNSLEEVRNEVDKLDDQIVELIAARNAYIHQAVKFKQSVEEVKAEDRVKKVMERVRHKALALGLSPNLITDLYKKMIDAMVELEISEFRDRGAL
jgi:isochorismate pyruvate lyase